MNEYENPNVLPEEDALYEVIPEETIQASELPGQEDRYTYYAGTPQAPGEYPYVPEPKTKPQKKMQARIGGRRGTAPT